MNTLYYGDNLDILRRYVEDESVDLVYLDPPFKSNQDYNVLFAEQDGSRSAAQIKAFDDTWQWDQEAARTYQDVVEHGPEKVSKVMQAFRTFLGDNDLLAYLSMMSPRLVELRRVLKPTGSIYLHCDPTASHYLKMLLDSVFGPSNFLNEISWRRSTRRSSISKILRRAHDVILLYSKSSEYAFAVQHEEKGEKLLRKYSLQDERGPYQLVPLMVSGKRNGETGKPWRGIDPTPRGKAGMHWVTLPSKIEEYERRGLVVWTSVKGGGTPRLKYYLNQNEGVPLSDFWDDIDIINSMGNEALGYPTQKPIALLERIIQISSSEGCTVLDPFCGCGTAIHAAQQLKRKWIGIDITHLAITLIKHRLLDAFGAAAQYRVIGEPVSIEDAEELAGSDPYQFQWWALGLVGARPAEQKKGADKGIDGRLYFHDEPKTAKQIIFSVKAGALHANYVRDLHGVITREKAEIGVLISLDQPTQPMRSEAASAGFYQAPYGKRHARLQLLTVAELLAGKGIDYPAQEARRDVTFKQAPKAKGEKAENQDLPF